MTTQDQIPPSLATKLVDRIHVIMSNDPDPVAAESEILWRFIAQSERFAQAKYCEDEAKRAHALWALDEIAWLALAREHRTEQLPEPVKHPV